MGRSPTKNQPMLRIGVTNLRFSTGKILPESVLLAIFKLVKQAHTRVPSGYLVACKGFALDPRQHPPDSDSIATAGGSMLTFGFA